MAEQSSFGSRVGSIALGFVIGAAYGAVGTVAHQSTVAVGGVDLPWGLIVALIGATALLVGLRLVVDDRLVVGACAVGLLGVIVLLSLRSVGGSVLVPNGVSGLVWIIGTAAVAALTIAWPRLPQQHPARQHA